MPVEYRFCGITEPHYPHMFYRDSGVWMGSANYNCIGHMVMANVERDEWQ